MKELLEELERRINAGDIGRAKAWGGADVVIVDKFPTRATSDFYPEPRYVETKFVNQLSWLFEQIRDVFNKIDGYGIWKEELFGRLGNAANGFTGVSPDGSLRGLLGAVMDEAREMAEEIDASGQLASLMITSDNRILDDFKVVADSNEYLSQEEVKKRFDLYLGDWAIELDREKRSSDGGEPGRSGGPA